MKINVHDHAPEHIEWIKNNYSGDDSRNRELIFLKFATWCEDNNVYINTQHPIATAENILDWYDSQDKMYDKKTHVVVKFLDWLKQDVGIKTKKGLRDIRQEVTWKEYRDVAETKSSKSIPASKLVEPNEIILLYSLSNDRIELLCRMMFDTGMRVGELGAIRPKDVSDTVSWWDNKEEFAAEVMVRRKQTNRGEIENYTKGKENRRVGIRHKTKVLLDQYIQEKNIGQEDVIFKANNTIRNQLKKGTNSLDIRTGDGEQSITPHSFRHTMATFLANNRGWSMIDLQKYGGWSDTATVQKYMDFINPEIYEKLEEVI